MLSFYLSIIKTQEDRSFFSMIYTAYRQPLFKYAAKLLGDAMWAEDVVHDVFLSVIKSGVERLRSIQDASERMAYLCAAVRNQCKSFLLKKKDSNLIFTQEINRYLERSYVAQTEPYEEDVQVIVDAIRSLGETYSDVLYYALVYDMSAAAISELLGLSQATVRKRISRGKEMLRVKLKGEYKE